MNHLGTIFDHFLSFLFMLLHEEKYKNTFL